MPVRHIQEKLGDSTKLNQTLLITETVGEMLLGLLMLRVAVRLLLPAMCLPAYLYRCTSHRAVHAVESKSITGLDLSADNTREGHHTSFNQRASVCFCTQMCGKHQKESQIMGPYTRSVSPLLHLLYCTVPRGGQRSHRRKHADKNSSITQSLIRAGSNLNSNIAVNNSPEPSVRRLMMQACAVPKGCGVREPGPQDWTELSEGRKKKLKRRRRPHCCIRAGGSRG